MPKHEQKMVTTPTIPSIPSGDEQPPIPLELPHIVDSNQPNISTSPQMYKREHVNKNGEVSPVPMQIIPRGHIHKKLSTNIPYMPSSPSELPQHHILQQQMRSLAPSSMNVEVTKSSMDVDDIDITGLRPHSQIHIEHHTSQTPMTEITQHDSDEWKTATLSQVGNGPTPFPHDDHDINNHHDHHDQHNQRQMQQQRRPNSAPGCSPTSPNSPWINDNRNGPHNVHSLPSTAHSPRAADYPQPPKFLVNGKFPYTRNMNLNIQRSKSAENQHVEDIHRQNNNNTNNTMQQQGLQLQHAHTTQMNTNQYNQSMNINISPGNQSQQHQSSVYNQIVIPE